MTVSVAIVGAGRIARSHLNELRGIEGARIVGVADIRPDAAASLAGEVGARSYRDYREMLEQTKPDAVYICTPAGEHLAQLSYAAERGINVFVEKPLAPSMSAATEAADIVDKHGILCTVGYQWRYSPVVDRAVEALGNSPITMLAAWWYWTIPKVWWIKDKRFGGGQMIDQGTHLIDLMRYLAGDVDTTYGAYSDNAVPQDELPNWDANAVTLRFASGAAGSVHTTYALFPGIAGSNGLDVIARELLVRVNLRQLTVFRPGADPVHTAATDGWNISQSFIPIIERNSPESIRATAREAAKSIAVSLAANYSATTGKVVDMAEFMAHPPDDADIMPTDSPDFSAAPPA